jgi:hypothetical protein
VLNELIIFGSIDDDLLDCVTRELPVAQDKHEEEEKCR